MKLCIVGKNNIAVDILYHAVTVLNKEDIAVVVNKTEDFKNSWQKSLGFHSKLLGIPIYQLNEIQQIPNIIFLSLEFDRIIKPDLFKTDNLYNIHFSLLPEYKGMYTSILPILHGKNYSGVTLHKIDRGIDTGDIIDQKKFDIKDFTCQDLYFKYLEEGTLLVRNNFNRLLNEKILGTKQVFEKSTYFSKNSFNFENIEINPNQTGFQICNFVRSLYFRPYQLPTFKGIKIKKAEIVNEKPMERPSNIIYENQEYFIVTAIDCLVKLEKDYYQDLIDAIKLNDIKKVKIIAKLVSNINEYNENGWNPIIIASYYGNVEIVRELVKAGADIFSKNLNGTTTLMYAKDSCEKTKDLSLIEYLLNQGIKVHQKDLYNKTVIDYTNDKKLLDYLIKYD